MKKMGLKTYLWWVFGRVWTRFFIIFNFPPTLRMYNIFLEQKSWIDFSPHFHPFFTVKPTSESFNDPLKVLTEGSMVEWIPSSGVPGSTQNHYCPPKISRPEILNHNPSPLCISIFDGSTLDGVFNQLCDIFFYSRAAASLMMVSVGIVLVVHQTIVS